MTGSEGSYGVSEVHLPVYSPLSSDSVAAASHTFLVPCGREHVLALPRLVKVIVLARTKLVAAQGCDTSRCFCRIWKA
jgi:hypothetical protein